MKKSQILSMVIPLILSGCGSTTHYELSTPIEKNSSEVETNRVRNGEELISEVQRKRLSERSNGKYIIIKAVFPLYPDKAKEAGIEGYVVIEFTINKAGSVADTLILHSGGLLLDEATIKAIKKWKFQPVIENGIPVEVKFQQKFTFKMP